MHHDTTGEVNHAPFHEESLRMPRHVGQRTVDDEEEKHHEEHVGREAYALSKRARDQRRRNDSELHLEQGKQCQWNRRTKENLATIVGRSYCEISWRNYEKELKYANFQLM